MRRILWSLAVIISVSTLLVHSVQSQQEPTKHSSPNASSARDENKTRPTTDRSADEAAIRANIDAFVKAYNAGDAKAVAALFTPDAQAEDKDGGVTEGRDAIQQVFADLFAENPKLKTEV